MRASLTSFSHVYCSFFERSSFSLCLLEPIPSKSSLTFFYFIRALMSAGLPYSFANLRYCISAQMRQQPVRMLLGAICLVLVILCLLPSGASLFGVRHNQAERRSSSVKTDGSREEVRVTLPSFEAEGNQRPSKLRKQLGSSGISWHAPQPTSSPQTRSFSLCALEIVLRSATDLTTRSAAPIDARVATQRCSANMSPTALARHPHRCFFTITA